MVSSFESICETVIFDFLVTWIPSNLIRILPADEFGKDGWTSTFILTLWGV